SWGIKDLSSRHVSDEQGRLPLYQARRYVLISRGGFDDEFPASWAELSDDLKEHDRLTENSEQRVTVIETHYWYGKENADALASARRSLIFDEKQGVHWYDVECQGSLDSRSPLDLHQTSKKPTTYYTRKSTTECFYTGQSSTLYFCCCSVFQTKKSQEK
ncbi:LuxR family transcriptional regulator, partial [Nannocystaceae bacterium ST9]